MEKETKAERIKSPEYRIFIGRKLKERRVTEGYTLNDIKVMTGIPVNTLVSVEKGVVTNIDYYVEFAKAVRYPLPTLRQANIKMQPTNKLSADQLKRIKLTKEIRVNIVLTDFLSKAKSSQEIKVQLEKLKVIPVDSVTTSDIAGVMRNLIADDIVKIESKVGNRNTYIITE